MVGCTSTLDSAQNGSNDFASLETGYPINDKYGNPIETMFDFLTPPDDYMAEDDFDFNIDFRDGESSSLADLNDFYNQRSRSLGGEDGLGGQFIDNLKQNAEVFLDSTSEAYDNLLGAWELGKNQVRLDNERIALSDAGGAMTFAVAFMDTPREIGFGLIDAGLSLGGIFASQNVRDGFIEQYSEIYESLPNNLVDFSDSDIRFSATAGNYKALIGTDRMGVQYKNEGSLYDSVTRVSIDYDDGIETELLTEFNSPIKPTIFRQNIGGVPVNGKIVGGIRQNLTSGTMRPAINLEFSSDLVKDAKFSFEWRGPRFFTTTGGK
jgi:hypothetical protein